MKDFSPYCPVEEVSGLIALALAKNIPFYVCRYPDETACRCGLQVDSTPVHDVCAGYNVVPFDVSGTTPSFTIQPDYFPAQLDAISKMSRRECVEPEWNDTDIDCTQYMQVAEQLIADMRNGRADKVVLSRTITHRCDVHNILPQYYEQLCRMYPTAYVFIVSYPGVCGWVGATPEVLFRSHSTGYETMALAGTRKAGTQAPWGEKEKQEQRYVVQYIDDILYRLGCNSVESRDYTKVAAQVEHLCTQFSVTMPHDATSRDRLIDALHPTPAVAGTPTQEAISMIREIEPHERRYYGGYVGERHADGRCGLFVNLRSMEFTSQAIRLYVGGGLTAHSQPLDEWNETCAKAQTLLCALQQI